MRDIHPSSPSVVVGIDGSRSGVTAALWAVDEAVERDIPLRLVYAIEPGNGSPTPEHASRSLATAETAVRMALVAVESTDRPVKVEVEILQGPSTDKLLEASRAAAMVCVGAIGLKHATAGRIGSTAAALATRASCPVAIIRGHDPTSAQRRAILVEMDPSPDSDFVLRRGICEARLRNAPLVAISAWQSRVTDSHDSHGVAEQNRRISAALYRRLASLARTHPELDVQTGAVHGSLLNYLSHHAQSIQLVIIDRRRTHGIAEMIGPSSYAALRDTDCSVLVCQPKNPL